MIKKPFLFTALGASLLVASQTTNATTNANSNSSIYVKQLNESYELRILSNGYGYLTQDGHIYILMREVVSEYRPSMLNDLLLSGEAMICNQANCDKLNISTEDIKLLL